MKQVFIISMILCLTLSIQFSTTIAEDAEFCFAEFLVDSTPFHLKVQTQFNTGQYYIIAHFKKAILTKKTDQTQVIKKIGSYAAQTGDYQFCIQNYSRKQVFKIYFNQGIQVSDKLSLPKQSDSKIIDKMVDKLNEVYQQVREQEHYSITVNEYNMELQKLVSFKSVGFGFLSITVVLIISFLHYLEIKRVLRNRKII